MENAVVEAAKMPPSRVHSDNQAVQVLEESRTAPCARKAAWASDDSRPGLRFW